MVFFVQSILAESISSSKRVETGIIKSPFSIEYEIEDSFDFRILQGVIEV